MRSTERVGDGLGAQRHKCKGTGTCKVVQDRVRRLARTNKAPDAGTGKRQEASTCAPVSPSFADPHTRTRRCVNNAIRACFRLTHSRNEERETRERHPLHVYMGTAKLTQAHAQEPCTGTTRCLPAWGRVPAYGWAHLHAELAARRRESRLKVPFAAMFRSHREPRQAGWRRRPYTSSGPYGSGRRIPALPPARPDRHGAPVESRPSVVKGALHGVCMHQRLICAGAECNSLSSRALPPLSCTTI
jgi:hypothetical protein